MRFFALSLLLVAVGSGSAQLLADLRSAYGLYHECGGSGSCLKLKLLAGIERASRAQEISVLPGVRLIAAEGTPQGPPPTEEQLIESLPRSLDQDDALDNVIQDKAAAFLQSHSVQFKLSEFGRALQEEGRGKRKRGLGTLLLLWLMMAGTLIPIKLGTLALLAGKALIISKLALALAAIVGLKKLLSSGDDHETSYQVVQVPGHHGHRRNLEAAQDIAYRGYAQAAKLAVKPQQ